MPRRCVIVGLVVEAEACRAQHHARTGDDARPQVVDVGRIGAHLAAVQAEHDGRSGARHQPVGPDRRVRPGERQPACGVDPCVDVTDEVHGELVACRSDRPETQLRTGRIGTTHPGGQPPRERPPGLSSGHVRAHGEERPQRFGIGAVRHANDAGKSTDDAVARSHNGAQPVEANRVVSDVCRHTHGGQCAVVLAHSDPIAWSQAPTGTASATASPLPTLPVTVPSSLVHPSRNTGSESSATSVRLRALSP